MSDVSVLVAQLGPRRIAFAAPPMVCTPEEIRMYAKTMIEVADKADRDGGLVLAGDAAKLPPPPH